MKLTQFRNSSKKKYVPIFAALLGIVLGYFIINILNKHLQTYIDAFNQRIPTKLAYILAQEVEETIRSKSHEFNLDRFNQYNRNNLRVAIKQFTKKDPDIRAIILINPQHQIVVSTDPSIEDYLYRDSEELALLDPPVPQIIERRANDKIEELDVIWPVLLDKDFRGHIRLVIGINQLHSLDEARQYVVWGAGFAIGAIILLALLLTWQVNRRTAGGPPEALEGGMDLREVKQPAARDNGDPGNSVFTKLSELYDKSSDLSKSFQESEEKIHSMMRVLNQGVLILDLNMHIITHNEYILDVFNIRTKSSAQRKVYELIQRNPRMLEMYRWAKDPLTHEVKQIFDLSLLNGRNINVEVLARPFYNGEDVAGVTFYIKNLEVLSELEQTLQRSMKYGVISQLSSSIGHEIRNPLSSLAIHTEIVDNMVSRSVDDKARRKKIKKSINILNSEVERLQKLIDQFFNLAKAQEIKLTFVNINDLMEEIHDLVQQQALENNVQISKYFSKNLPMVKVSKDQLKQVIINLILNAFDAMSGGGDLALRTRYREGKVVISIKDSGQGIPDNVKENIFDLYFTTKDSGGGIGLAISRKIIEAHEGKLYFESKTGVGTIFYIELPTSQK